MIKYSISKCGFIFALVFLLQACGGSTHTETRVVEKTQAGSPDALIDHAFPQTNNTEIELENFAVIRELGPSQTAALFGLKTKKGVLKILGITGPTFLKTVSRQGELNATSVQDLFKNLTVPMSEAEKSALLADHRGAWLIYFEKYEGSLCMGQDNESKIVVEGTVDGRPFTTSFVFSAAPSSSGDCKFHYLSLITQT